MAEGRIVRPQSHDDMLGYITTGLANSHQWIEEEIGNTLFPIPWLRDNSGDYYCVYAQSPHTRKQGELLDSIHIHYILATASTAGQTIVYDLYYTWIRPGQVVPSLSGWTQLIGVTQVLGTHAALYSDIVSIAEEIPPPSPEGYGGTLLWRIVRGNGTYTGKLGILASDAHMLVDRDGSKYEFSDTL